jgi:hypothetical protein
MAFIELIVRLKGSGVSQANYDAYQKVSYRIEMAVEKRITLRKAEISVLARVERKRSTYRRSDS